MTMQWWKSTKVQAVAGLTVVGLVAGGLLVPRLAESTSPIELGVSQPPLVTLIFDTSASMQWTGLGSNSYSYLPSSESWEPSAHLESWVPGSMLNLPGSSQRDSDGNITVIPPDEFGDAVWSVGPCMVWHPASSSQEQCSNYVRPGTCATLDGNDCVVQTEEGDIEIGYPSLMRDHLEEMLARPEYRLSEDANTPRHIQIKQILTGEIHLTGGTDTRPGPGCWFVPRARGALRDEQVCCESFDPLTFECTGNSSAFDFYLDYADPVPHYQEVYDFQVRNGLLDAMSSTALFSAVMLDSYRQDGTRTGGWQFPTTDIMAGDSPYPGDNEDGSCGGNPCYDMGVFRFIGPTSLDIDDDRRIALSDFVQEAILNTGFLFPDEGNLRRGRVVDGEDVDAPVFEYPLGKQPVALATPWGAVFHDLHQFFMEGQYAHKDSSDVINPFSPYEPGDGGDPYLGCRGRHMVLLTDGDEVLEVSGLGSELLRPEFGYDPDRYAYFLTEDAIDSMFTAIEAQMNDVLTGALDHRNKPRVHVLSVTADDPDVDPDHFAAVVEKTANVAAAGRTCAQYYLPSTLIPVGYETGRYDSNNNVIMGGCEPEDPVCLVPQGLENNIYNPPENPDRDFECLHPALMLTANDRATMTEAIQLILNEIAQASGLAARTRPAITNYIDDDEKVGQYRIFSGLRIGGSLYWQGILNSHTLECDFDGDDLIVEGDIRHLHRDMLRLRHEIGTATDSDLDDPTVAAASHDRRRIFTSIPKHLMGQMGDHGSSEIGDLFIGTFDVMEPAEEDQFGDHSIFGVPSGGTSRVIFTQEDLFRTFEEEPFEFSDNSFYEYWRAYEPNDLDLSREDYFDVVIERYRGMSASRFDRVLGGIFNSSPVAVGPPDLDLPVDSYRRFRREYRNRRTMLYVASVDGQIHAIHAGENEVQARASLTEEGTGTVDAEEQREAWAYIPALLHRRLFDSWNQAEQFMDGSPVIRDIRLCHGIADHNTNNRVCPTDGTGVPPESQWRTVMVVGMGTSPGYVAMDVTRAGQEGDRLPDPLVMWEFGREWERQQIQKIVEDSDPSRVGAEHDPALDDCEASLGDNLEGVMCGVLDFPDCPVVPPAAELPFLGSSIAEPALGTVTMRLGTFGLQRAVAIFGGGSPAGAPLESDECTEAVTGRAAYIVDLQSGAIIRRFVEYEDGGSTHRLPAPVTGTPVMSATRPGEVSTRAFIGDDSGRLYRIDMTDFDPNEWTMELFFDPYDPPDSEFPSLGGEYTRYGPASFRPAVTTGLTRDLVVIYGLGQRGDTGSADSLQAVIAIEEQRDVDMNTAGQGQMLWVQDFEPRERLTGAPVVFDGDVFFTTYVEPLDRCMAGTSRIYRLSYDGVDPSEPDAEPPHDPIGKWPVSNIDTTVFIHGDESDDGLTPWFGPIEPTLIRGVAVTAGPVCAFVEDDVDTMSAAREMPAPRPQLVAQAGTADVGETGGGGLGGGTGGGTDISRIAVDLDVPRTQAFPLSWTVIGN